MRLLPPTPVSRTASQLSCGCENPSTSGRTARPGSPPTPSWIPFALTRAFKTSCAAWAFHSKVCSLDGVREAAIAGWPIPTRHRPAHPHARNSSTVVIKRLRSRPWSVSVGDTTSQRPQLGEGSGRHRPGLVGGTHRNRFTHPGSRTCSSSSRCSRAAMIPGLPR